ncbi:MAG TPA: RNA-protein complex protein Nop10 [Methanomassiliicoccales archaeon]|nr:RNA-protein complex protein Nop10 [Euryarchaeota archaeon]HOE52474.1 RNA-protein complex protein Nop10 [Methanomassiliicoccales archaeon]HQM66368.1 RNA-protein complex protein Nop10 [Methanomassiliicoccales archaeon]HRU11112.1 RNA-protein complex protein Nop10 [Methanomassiliicoccales archaeon]
MKTTLRLCEGCAEYTLKDTCPRCGAKTSLPIPPRYSPEDRYGEYRRRARQETR